MSDRIAVFNRGRIEQCGTPNEIYERPATAFVATFVGTSNLLNREQAKQLLQHDTMVAVRPEKIQIADVDSPLMPNAHCVTGIIREVIYLGVNTRYLVDLDGGGEMIALEQNLRTNSANALAARGRKVNLMWQHDDCQMVQG